MTQELLIREVVAAVLSEQRADSKVIAQEAVATVLMSFGLDSEDQKEMKADFAHLRRWRRSVESAEGLTFRIIITTIVTGFLATVWLGVKTYLGK